MTRNEGQTNSAKFMTTRKILGFTRRFWEIQFLRFLVTGGINSLFGYSIYSLFILMHVHYSIASLGSTILGVIFNFFTTGRIVFKNSNIKLVFRFVGVYGISYIVNLLFLSIFNHFQVNMVLAGAILLLPIALLSYFLNKKLVFKVKDPKYRLYE
jgi:putative flippase GtrA